MKYKAIGFDWNGVISGISGSEFSRSASQTVGVDVVTFRRAYFENNYLINKEHATREVFWRAVLDDLKAVDKLPQLLKYLDGVPRGVINLEVAEIVKTLKEKGMKLGLVSNETVEGGKTIKEADVSQYFDAILISAEVGFMKPQPEIYRLLMDKLGVLPEELIFVDDAEKSLEGADDIGIVPILFTTPQDLTEKLRDLGVMT